CLVDRRCFLHQMSGVAATSVILRTAVRAPYAPQDDILGEMGDTVTQTDGTLLDVARDHDLGFLELMAATQATNPWIPGDGVSITLPTAHLLPRSVRDGVVLNLGAMRLFYFPPNDAAPQSYPIGMGVEGAPTPLGSTYIAKKTVHPTWYPPAD